MITTFNPFSITYDDIDTPILDFKSECILAVRKAQNKNIYNLPISVLMSGGIDSELIGEALLLADVNFCVSICRYIVNVAGNDVILNDHDYQYAIRWCNKNNICINFYDIDIYKDASKVSEYALSVDGFSPQYGCYMDLMKRVSDDGYFFLCGNGEMDFVLLNNEYYMLDEQREFTLGNFCNKHSLNGVWQFWKQDARIAAAFIKLPTVVHLMKTLVPRILDFKHACFADVFVFENRIKTTGFERIQEWDSILRNQLKKHTGLFDAKYYTHISRFI